MRTHTRLILINLLGVVFALAGVASLIILESRFERYWNRWHNEIEAKTAALSDTRAAVGYGGMIHALKNYVLRREPQYVGQFTSSVERARDSIARFRAVSTLTADEEANLARVEEMIASYEDAMRRSIGSEQPAIDLDASIRIDDTLYLAAMERLESGVADQAVTMAAEIERELVVGTMVGVAGGLLGSVCVIGFGGLLAYRVGRRLERETDERAKAMLEVERSRQQSQFLANMSHEIRTPLNAVLGYAQLAQEQGLSEVEREVYLSTVRRNGKHLMDLVNSVLDLSKIEAGRLGLSVQAVDPREVIEEVLSLVGVRAHEKNLRVRVEYEQILPRRLKLDPLRLRQILVNLVGNAVKFTSEGEVVVRVSFEPCGDREGELRVGVVDTGIGIDAADVEAIFGSFEQADPSMTRRFGGTGLGLHISRRLARLMGGDIAVRSSKGVGSEFTAFFPVEVVDGPAPADPESARRIERRDDALAGVRVLVVEDGEDNQRLIYQFLSRSGAVVESAKDGVEALAAIDRSGPFDVVLMDIQMPNMDGYEATRRLRDAGYDRPIIALTAHAMSDDRERCLAVGCDDYATKPIDRAELVGLCARRLELWRARGPALG